VLPISGRFFVHGGGVAGHCLLGEFHKLLQILNFECGVGVGDALDCFDTLCNCFNHFVGMGDGRVGDILVVKLYCVSQPLASC